MVVVAVVMTVLVVMAVLVIVAVLVLRPAPVTASLGVLTGAVVSSGIFVRGATRRCVVVAAVMLARRANLLVMPGVVAARASALGRLVPSRPALRILLRWTVAVAAGALMHPAPRAWRQRLKSNGLRG